MPTEYATVAELKGYPNISLSTDDTEIQVWLNAAAAVIDRWTGRDTGDPDTEGFVAVAVATAKEFIGNGTPVLRVGEHISITSVEVKDSPTDLDTSYTALAATDFIAFRGDPLRPDFESLPLTQIMVDQRGDYAVWVDGRMKIGRGFSQPTVRVTARWGYAAAAPPEIKSATIAQALRWLTRGRSGWGDATSTPDLGMLLFRQALDPDIKMMLQRFQLPQVG